jgi:hypothetical protein
MCWVRIWFKMYAPDPYMENMETRLHFFISVNAEVFNPIRVNLCKIEKAH